MHLDLVMEIEFRVSSITIVPTAADANAVTTNGATLITAASGYLATIVVDDRLRRLRLDRETPAPSDTATTGPIAVTLFAF